MTKKEKQQELIKAVEQVGKLAASQGCENGHWFMLDLRALRMKMRMYWEQEAEPITLADCPADETEAA